MSLIVYLFRMGFNVFKNSEFSNNTGGRSVISIYRSRAFYNNSFINCTISDNAMTGITLFETTANFIGCNVIENNQNTHGAGITLVRPSFITVNGELFLYNNTADKHGGAILVVNPFMSGLQYHAIMVPCTIIFGNSSLVTLQETELEKEEVICTMLN